MAMLYVREFSWGDQPGPIGRAGEVDVGSQNDCEFVDAGGVSRWHTSSKRNLPNQLMDQGVPERIDVLRGGDKGAGAADDLVSVVVRKPAWRVGVIGLRRRPLKRRSCGGALDRAPDRIESPRSRCQA
jgi:hypothetical protein